MNGFEKSIIKEKSLITQKISIFITKSQSDLNF